MKTHIRRQQHKNLKHQVIKQKETPQHLCKKVLVGKDQEKAQSERDSHSKKA